MLQSWSRVQATVALSSCEAELGSLVTAATEAIGIQSLTFKAGFGKLPTIIATDSKAAYDSMKKLGPGKLKHVQLRWWYLQDAVRYGIIQLRRVPGEDNRSDVLTKAVGRKTLLRHMANANAKKAEKQVMIVSTLTVVDSSYEICTTG